MALSVQTNVASLTAQRNLLNSSNRLNTSLERLSTGLKINRASDDASGLVISENQRAQINGLEQAIANTDRALNLVQTAESALSEVNTLLLNIRQLVVDSANEGANDAEVLAANQADIDNLLDTIDRITGQTKFGTINLLNGNGGVSAQADDAEVTFIDATGRVAVDTSAGNQAVNVLTAGERAIVSGAAAALTGDESLTINGVVFNFAGGTTQTQVVAAVNQRTADTGVQAAFTGGALRYETVQFGADESVSVQASTTALGVGTADTVQTDRGVDIGGTIGGVAGNGIGNLLKAGGITISVDSAGGVDSHTTVTGAQGNIGTFLDNSRVFQIGAFENETATLSIGRFASGDLGRGTTQGNGTAADQFTSLADINVSTFDRSTNSLLVVDQSIKEVANARGEIGAFQSNTLEATQRNTRSELQNLEEAESTVRDTDFASEIAKFTNEQIRQQSASTVLGLANQSAQAILALLQQ